MWRSHTGGTWRGTWRLTAGSVTKISELTWVTNTWWRSTVSSTPDPRGDWGLQERGAANPTLGFQSPPTLKTISIKVQMFWPMWYWHVSHFDTISYNLLFRNLRALPELCQARRAGHSCPGTPAGGRGGHTEMFYLIFCRSPLSVFNARRVTNSTANMGFSNTFSSTTRISSLWGAGDWWRARFSSVAGSANTKTVPKYLKNTQIITNQKSFKKKKNISAVISVISNIFSRRNWLGIWQEIMTSNPFRVRNVHMKAKPWMV